MDLVHCAAAVGDQLRGSRRFLWDAPRSGIRTSPPQRYGFSRLQRRGAAGRASARCGSTGLQGADRM